MQGEERKIVKTAQLEIDGNIMKYGSSVIQMRNITRCEVAPMPERPIPKWAIVGMILGLIICFSRLIWQGLFVMLVSASFIVWVSYKNEKLGTYLIIELNSGESLFFECYNIAFLKEVQEAILDCFSYNNVSYTINFFDCAISDAQIGEHNEVNYR